MKLSEKSISVLATIITGDSKKSPYRTGPKLVDFFNQFSDVKDSYGQGFPTRWYYARDKLNLYNDSEKIKLILEASVDPRYFLGTEFDLEEVIIELNQYLDFDNLKLSRAGKYVKVNNLILSSIELKLFDNDNNISTAVIELNIQKSDKKLQEGDYSGAITNARSLVESVLIEIEKKLDPQAIEFNGDLIKLFSRAQKLLNFEPGRRDIGDTIRQISSGLISIVNGLAGLRNKASDAHGSDFQPDARHARLAVNSAKTICDFVVDEFLEKRSK